MAGFLKRDKEPQLSDNEPRYLAGFAVTPLCLARKGLYMVIATLITFNHYLIQQMDSEA